MLKKLVKAVFGVCLFTGIVFAQVEMTVNQGVSRENVKVGEDVTVTLSISNSGNAATQVKVTAILPSGVTATDPVSGVQSVTGDMNIWDGELEPGDAKAVKYLVRANEEGHFMIFSTVKYTDDGIEREIQLTSEFTAREEPIPAPAAPVQTAPPQRGICGPTAILALAMVPVVLFGAFKRFLGGK